MICPHCKYQVPNDATRCPHCTSNISEFQKENAKRLAREDDKFWGVLILAIASIILYKYDLLFYAFTIAIVGIGIFLLFYLREFFKNLVDTYTNYKRKKMKKKHWTEKANSDRTSLNQPTIPNIPENPLPISSQSAIEKRNKDIEKEMEEYWERKRKYREEATQPLNSNNLNSIKNESEEHFILKKEFEIFSHQTFKILIFPNTRAAVKFNDIYKIYSSKEEAIKALETLTRIGVLGHFGYLREIKIDKD